MFSIGDRVIYGHMGACEIADITVPPFCKPDARKQYYELCPCNQTGSIFVPVDADVYMRPLVSRDEVERLIAMIPNMQAQAFDCASMQALKQHYADALGTHTCEDLIELLMSIYAKKQQRIKNNQKFGAIDEGVMRRAEELLYSEFAFALDIPKESVQRYIADRLRTLNGKSAGARGEGRRDARG